MQYLMLYVHKFIISSMITGRTGRAGRPGKAITFFTENDAGYLRKYDSV